MKILGIIIAAMGVVLLFIHAAFLINETISFILGGVLMIAGAMLIVSSIKRKE